MQLRKTTVILTDTDSDVPVILKCWLTLGARMTANVLHVQLRYLTSGPENRATIRCTAHVFKAVVPC